MVKKFVCDLNNGINKGESYVIIDRNFLSLKILYILQRHNLISSFNTINKNKVLVNFRFISFRHNVINQIHSFQRRGSFIKRKKNITDKKSNTSFSIKYFTIVSTRYGIMSNRRANLLNIEGIPLIAIE